MCFYPNEKLENQWHATKGTCGGKKSAKASVLLTTFPMAYPGM